MSSVRLSTSVKPLGAASRAVMASTDPAAPAAAALTMKAEIRARPSWMPASSAETSSSRTARHRRPTRPRARLASSTNVTMRVIQPR